MSASQPLHQSDLAAIRADLATIRKLQAGDASILFVFVFLLFFAFLVHSIVLNQRGYLDLIQLNTRHTVRALEMLLNATTHG